MEATSLLRNFPHLLESFSVQDLWRREGGTPLNVWARDNRSMPEIYGKVLHDSVDFGPLFASLPASDLRRHRASTSQVRTPRRHRAEPLNGLRANRIAMVGVMFLSRPAGRRTKKVHVIISLGEPRYVPSIGPTHKQPNCVPRRFRTPRPEPRPDGHGMSVSYPTADQPTNDRQQRNHWSVRRVHAVFPVPFKCPRKLEPDAACRRIGNAGSDRAG